MAKYLYYEPMDDSANRCALEILETIPIMMGHLRCHLRRNPETALTMVQFRVLSFLELKRAISLSLLADFLEMGLPSTSKIIDGLVTAGLVSRETDPSDRRRVVIKATQDGKKAFKATRRIAQNYMAQTLSRLGSASHEQVIAAFQLLRPLFPHLCPEGVEKP